MSSEIEKITAVAPGLTEERLKAVVRIIADARLGAADRQDEEFGDDAQVLGIRAYKNMAMTLEEVAGSEGYEWLQVFQRKARFTISIEGVALRIWRADDLDLEAEEKRLILALEVMSQISLFESEYGVIDRWGIVYQKDIEGHLLSASVVGYNSISLRPIIKAPIKIDGEIVIGLASVTDDLPAAVKKEKPKVALRIAAKEEPKRHEENING